jgi:hypothetical protein
VLPPQDAAGADEADRAPGGAGAAAGAEEEEVVAGLVVVDDPAVDRLDVARQTHGEGSATEPLARPHAEPSWWWTRCSTPEASRSATPGATSVTLVGHGRPSRS